MLQLGEAAGISLGSVIEILHEDLDLRKLNTEWETRLLKIDQKRQRLHTRIGTTSKKVDTIQWNCTKAGRQKRKIINSDQNCALLDRLKEGITRKPHRLLEKKASYCKTMHQLTNR